MNYRKLETRLLVLVSLAVFTITGSGPGASIGSWLFPTASAQSPTATLSGTALDPNGAVVPDVLITLTNVETTSRWQGSTDRTGYFVLPLLSPGRYLLTAQKQGFATLKVSDVVLRVNDQLALNVRLKVGQISESVTIEGASLAQTESAAVSTIVNHQFVENLPLNGRSFGALIELTPGVVLTRSNATEMGQFSVNGQRANANYFMVDGVSANVGTVGNQALAGTIPTFSLLGGMNNLVSVDALQEFRVQTSTYAAEFGRMPGAQVSVITRSGTNQFHGDAFDFFRNDALDANDWFANSRGLPKSALRQNDFGGVVGGPISKDRTFFFFSYEGLRMRQPQFAITASPTIAVRQAVPAELKPFIDAFPIPNGRDLGNGFAESFAGYSNPFTLNATSIRIDHRVNKRITLFGRFNYAPSESSQRVITLSPLNQLRTQRLNTTTLTLGSTQSVSPRTSNDFRMNWSRNTGQGTFSLDDFQGGTPPPDSVVFPPSTKRGESLFGFTVGPITYFLGGDDVKNSQRQLNLIDSFFIISGRHQLKFGVDFRRLSPNSRATGGSGIALFAVYGDTNAVISNTPAASFVEAQTPRFPLFTNFSAFAQDTWKAMPRLTFSYGLRWEVNTPPSDRDGNHALTVRGLNNPATMVLAPVGTPLWETTYNNVAPRIGVAYQVSEAKGREMIVRGGFGVFYDVGTAPTGDAVIGVTVPYDRIQNFPRFPLDFSQISIPRVPFVPTPPYGRLFVFDPNLRLPLTYEWSTSIEQSIGSSQTLTVSYIGEAGRRLLRKEVLRGPSLNNPNFTQVVVSRNSATSDYDALQVQFQRRLLRRLQAIASYTWSHSIDIASADSSFNVSTTKLDPRIDRGSSSFDVRHSFSAAATYDIPATPENRIAYKVLSDWSVDFIFRARTATPLTAFVSQVLFGVPANPVRADLVTGVPLYIDDPTVAGGRRINSAAFKNPSPGRQGTLGRNVLRGFPLSQLDFSLRRGFSLGEQLNLQLRADLFNAFNHPNFGLPQTLLSDPLFGQSTKMLGRDLGGGGGDGSLSPLYQIGGPRSIQLSLKVLY